MSIRIVNGKSCVGCAACASVCANRCISMLENDEGFMFPSLQTEACASCDLCEKVCPALQKTNLSLLEVHRVYYAWHLDEKKRMLSSSGGVFTAVAEKVLDDGGVVFSAVYDSSLGRVVHGSTINYSLEQLRRSKYVESNVGETYIVAKNLLRQGKKVLYCGTPCQIAGINNYIGAEDKLITCDFICGGVNSNLIFQKYQELLESKYKSKITDVNFRPKTYGWKEHAIRILFENNRQYDSTYGLDRYFHGYFKHAFLRSSCYHCKYRVEHFSDITLADYWKYYEHEELINSDKGISLVVVNTQKGEDTFNNCSGSLYVKEIDPKYASYNYTSETFGDMQYNRRNDFLKKCNEIGFLKAADSTYMRGLLKLRIRKIAKRILKGFRR